MIPPPLLKWKTWAEMLALYSRDRIDMVPFTDVRDRNIRVEPAPFPHIVLDDFFIPDVYRGLSERFAAIARRGFLEEKWSPEYFHKFDIDYDGYVYTPSPTLNPTDPTSLFYSLEWNWFFSKIFRQFVTFETMLAYHHHPPGNRTGFVHNDNTDRPFSRERRLPNGVVYADGPPPSYRSRRKMALLFFLNNDGWKEGDGGETGLYSADGETLVKKVAPLNNRLLAFQISPISQHAFQENWRDRNSVVQWFHVPGELA